MIKYNKIIDFVSKNKLKIILFILVFLIAFYLRLFPIRISHWWDETVYLQHAEIFFSGRTNYNEFSFRPPLLSMLFFLVFFIKHHVFSASILVAFINTLAPVFIFLIGKKLYNFRAGVIAGLISAFAPFIIRNSNYLLTDASVITLMAISFYFALFNDKKSMLFLSGIFCSLAVLMKFTAILLFPILIFYFLINKISIKKILLFGVGAALVLTPYFIWMQISYGNFLIPFIKGPTFVLDKNESTYFYFFKFSEAFTKLVVLGLILWLFNLFIQIKKKNWNYIKIDLVLILWTALFLWYITKTPHKELRYILPLTVPVILLASKGFSLFFEHVKKSYKIVLWIIFILYLGFLVYPRITYINEIGIIDYTVSDEMIVANYILKEMNYTGVIYTNTRWPVLAYYTGLETIFLYPHNSKFYSEFQNSMKEPGLLIGMFDYEEPQPLRLKNNPYFTHVKDIGGFFIYEYKTR
ncbi:hypothetical protein COU57_03085 [Candidatus Pacearchaeota archaeon CG10_big_fil_rev_8_21_14_0_10_32_14]|nr:MAG: hypothetical protein COU57_03085 [Candidatus Pacearchaeota archaeon CG10_big_fil_rev_8_21_14_0_10_32_14]